VRDARRRPRHQDPRAELLKYAEAATAASYVSGAYKATQPEAVLSTRTLEADVDEDEVEHAKSLTETLKRKHHGAQVSGAPMGDD
jgi:hypothetical protein